MPWVKGHAGDRVNKALEAIQERHDCNKTEATEQLLRMGTELWEERYA